MGALIQGLVLSDRRLIDFPLPSSRSRSNRYPDPDYEVLMGFDDEMREGRKQPPPPPTARLQFPYPAKFPRQLSASRRRRPIIYMPPFTQDALIPYKAPLSREISPRRGSRASRHATSKRPPRELIDE